MTVHQGTWQLRQLNGGLQLALAERAAPDLLAARLWLAGGSSRDPRGQRGAHQLLAGVLTRGCGELSATALADLVEGRGAALRSEAQEDALVISLKCASSDADVLLPLMLQMASAPALDAEQIEIERQLNLQSLQRQREDPFQLCHEALRQLLYGEGPYGHDPLGVEAELEVIGRPQLSSLSSDLGSAGAALVVAGVIPTGTEQRLEDSLRHQHWQPAAAGRPIMQQHPLAQATIACCEEDTEQLVLMLGCRVPPLSDPDNLPLRVLQAHLGLGMSSRLFLALREERGLAYDVGVHMPARRGPTPFIWHLSTSADRAAEATAALLDEWQRVMEVALLPQELTLAKAKYQGQEAMGRQTCGQIADRQALLLGFGLPDDAIAAALQRAAALDAAALQAVARRHLPSPSLSLCGPLPALRAAERVWCDHPLRGV